MAKSVECTFKQVSHACRWSRHSSRLSQIRTNTVLYLGKTCWATTRSRPRFHTPLPRCDPDGHIQRNEVGKNLGFSLLKNMTNMKNMNIRKMNARITICYYKYEISCYEFKNMDLGTHIQGSCENKHKNMNLNANFQIKQDFFFKNTWTLFSLSKTNFKSMHDMKNGFDHAMQLDDQ